MFYFLGTVFISFLSGACTVIFAILYFVYQYKDEIFQTSKRPKIEYERNQLGNLLHYNLHNGLQVSTLGEKESCCFVNVLFAFIFREWRDTNQLQKWVLKKINIEFMEFMETKTASRLLQGLKVHDVSLGTNFPVFHSAKIKEPFSFTDDELPETIVLEVDMEYLGGFYLAIDVDLVFGKTAFLAVRITYLRGRVRLHFGRHPCTHWSLCFIEEPDIKFDVETSFETRQLPQLTSLIVNQIRRTIKRKHTFPQYKMRYNPFFSFQHPEISPFDGFIAEIPMQPSTLEVSVAAATRLLISPKGEKERNIDAPNYAIFATLSVNVESCVGKTLLSYISTPSTVSKNENSDNTSLSSDTPSTSKVSQTSTGGKNQTTAFDTFQRSFLGLKKDVTTTAPKPPTSSVTEKQSSGSLEQQAEDSKSGRSDSISSQSSVQGPTYVMVALNFGATLREETKDDGHKVVIVENITEHNASGLSGMKDGDTVVELNGVTITSLSQAITTIEKVRANKESFKFKVRRNRSDPHITGPNQNLDDSDRSNTSIDTESDHSDVESDDYKDFVNISLQVAEYHMKEGGKTRSVSTTSADRVLANDNLAVTDASRSHSNSVSSSDVPYMTLVSSPSPSTSAQNLKETTTGELKPSTSRVNERQLKKVEKETMKNKLDKIMSPRSRSESPPFFRRSNTPPKQSSPKITAKKGGKDNVKKEFPSKRDSSPARSSAEEVAESSKLPVKSESSDKISPPKPENLSFARVDDDPDSQLYKTSLANSNQREYSWNNEKFSFNIKEKHRYLNIRYWTRQVNKLGIIKTKPPQIIGCVAVPLCEIELFCRGVTSRRVTRRFPLMLPSELPQDHKWFLNDPVSHRPSFRERYCYGDTTLTIKLSPGPNNKNNNSNCTLDSAGNYYPEDDTNGMITKEMLQKLSEKTGSDYVLSSPLSKSQRLLVSRETQTGEKNNSVLEKDITKTTPNENIVTDPDIENKEDNLKPTEKVSLTQIIKGFWHSGKSPQHPKNVRQSEEPSKSEVSEDTSISEDVSLGCDGKVDDIIVGVISNRKTGFHQFELVKFTKPTKCSHCHNKLWMKTGLQCSVCHEICHKKCVDKFKAESPCCDSHESDKTGERNENFVVLETDNEDCASNSDSDGLPTAALTFRNKILDMTSSPSNKTGSDTEKKETRPKKYILSKNAEDLLAVNAKEMGRDLHRDLPLSERKKMLDSQIQKVENELHSEIAQKERLLEDQRAHEISSIIWKKFEKKIIKSDERLQALALLLLHYRAGLEDCDFETTEEGMILSDDEDEKYGVVGSESVTSAQKGDNSSPPSCDKNPEENTS